MLETEIKNLTKAIEELTKTIGAVGTTVSLPAQDSFQDAKATAGSPASSAVDDIFGTGDSTPAPTLDDVKVTLKAYLDKNGEQKTVDLLHKFKASKVTELKEADYAKVIAEASS